MLWGTLRKLISLSANINYSTNPSFFLCLSFLCPSLSVFFLLSLYTFFLINSKMKQFFTWLDLNVCFCWYLKFVTFTVTFKFQISALKDRKWTIPTRIFKLHMSVFYSVQSRVNNRICSRGSIPDDGHFNTGVCHFCSSKGLHEDSLSINCKMMFFKRPSYAHFTNSHIKGIQCFIVWNSPSSSILFE